MNPAPDPEVTDRQNKLRNLRLQAAQLQREIDAKTKALADKEEQVGFQVAALKELGVEDK